MFGSNILEVAIGLVMVYLVMSMICSGVTEWIARLFALRARTLKDGIYTLINDDKGLKEKIIRHPLFRALSAKTAKKHWWDNIKIGKTWQLFTKTEYGPSEIPPSAFSQIVIDTLIKDKNVLNKGNQQVVKSLGDSIESLPDKTKGVFSPFLSAAKTASTTPDGVIKGFQTYLENWFDNSMKRVTGWYKRKTQVIVLCLALLICFGMNVDTVGIANSLYRDPALRSVVVAAAETTVNESVSNNSNLPTYAQLSEDMSGIDLHLSWNTENNPNQKPDNLWGWFAKVFGILITVFALTMGAPFWFDLLKKLLSLRTGSKPDNSGDTTSPAG
ncbi:MAG: hypothetical protein ABR954_08175 [Dehalococcoidales bacterium]